MLSGLGQNSGGFCALFGTTDLFDEEQLAELYPTQEAYVEAITAATREAEAAGFLVPADAELIITAAQDFPLGGN